MLKISLLTKHGLIFVSEPKQTGTGLKYAKTWLHNRYRNKKFSMDCHADMLWCHQKGLTEAGMTQFRWLKWPQTVDCCLAAVTCCQGVFALRQRVAGSCFPMESLLPHLFGTDPSPTASQRQTAVSFFFSFCAREWSVSNGTSRCQHPGFHLGTACFTDRY